MPTNLRFLKLLLWGALLLLLPIAQLTGPVPTASAAACKTSSSTGSVKLGSKVTGDLVTICAKKDLLKKLKQTVKTKPIVNKPVVQKPLAKKTVAKRIAKPVAKRISKPATKTTNTITKRKRNNSVAAFRAMRPLANRSPAGIVQVGQPVSFKTQLSVKLARTTLLGQPVQVRFSPKQATWDFGDSQGAATVTARHAYSNKGTYQVTLKVRYAVAYRAVGGAWVAESTPIWLASSPLTVPVGVNTLPAGQASVVLIPSP